MGLGAAMVAIGSFVTAGAVGAVGASALSLMVAGAIGGAIVGAVVGGISAAIMGGDIMDGVLFGAVGGAVGGAMGGMFVEGGFFGADVGGLAAAGTSAVSPLESGSAMLLGGGEQGIGIGASGHLGVSSTTSSLATAGGGGGISFGGLGGKAVEMTVGAGKDFLMAGMQGGAAEEAQERADELRREEMAFEKDQLQMQIDAGLHSSNLPPDHQIELQQMRDKSALDVGAQRQTGAMETLEGQQAFTKSERQAGELRADEQRANMRSAVGNLEVKKQRVVAGDPDTDRTYVDTPDTKKFEGA